MNRKLTLTERVVQWWDRQGRRTRTTLVALFGLGAVALCVGAALAASAYLVPRLAPKPTATITARATAVPPTPTAVPTLMPTNTPPPTAMPTPTPEPSPTPPADPQGDVGTYASGDPVEAPPAGIDIRTASVAADRRVVLQPTTGMPAQLAAWANDDDVLLWIVLHDPVPDPPETYTEWLFALDLDGDVETGRPADSARINPDLGMEVAIGAFYDPASEEYDTYFLVWDTDQGAWARGPTKPRFTLSESRTLIGLAIPLGTLTETAAQVTGVTTVTEAVQGRAAALAQAGQQRAIDFYPDRPD